MRIKTHPHMHHPRKHLRNYEAAMTKWWPKKLLFYNLWKWKPRYKSSNYFFKYLSKLDGPFNILFRYFDPIDFNLDEKVFFLKDRFKGLKPNLARSPAFREGLNPGPGQILQSQGSARDWLFRIWPTTIKESSNEMK